MRIVVGGTLWALTALQWVAQAVTAGRWPAGYSWADNAISDLGVTVCGTFSEQGDRVREVCSPAHALFNGSLVVHGLLLVVGAVLLRDAWPRRRSGRAAMLAVAIGGVLVAAVGLLPWDVNPDAHDLTALGQALAQWVALALVLVTTRRRGEPTAVGTESSPAPWREIRVLTVAVLVLSVLGLVAFLAGTTGGEDLVLPWGAWERVAFESLTLWNVAVGVALAAGTRRRSPVLIGAAPPSPRDVTGAPRPQQ